MAVDTVGDLWHKRLCHMSQKGMKMLVGKELLPEVKTVHLDKCVECLVGKQSFRSRPPLRKKNAAYRSMPGGCKVTSGTQHFVTFIDDYS